MPHHKHKTCKAHIALSSIEAVICFIPKLIYIQYKFNLLLFFASKIGAIFVFNITIIEFCYFIDILLFIVDPKLKVIVGPQKGSHQATDERLHGVGPGSPSCHVQTVSASAELRAEQIAGQTLEVSMSI